MARKRSSWRSTGRRIGKALARKSPARRRTSFVRPVGLGVEWLEDRRLLAAGDLDTTFGISGRVVQDLGLGKNEEIYATAVQSDGKIVVAGMAINTSTAGRDFLVARFNSNGSLDNTFGTGGSVIVNVSDPGSPIANQDDVAGDLVIQADGSIIVAGTATKNVGAPGGPTNTGAALIKLTSSGVLDTSFDGDGKLITVFLTSPGQRRNAIPADTRPTGVALAPDGKIVVGTSTNAPSGRFDYTVARYNTDGSLDTTFDSDGYQITDIDGSSSSTADDFLFDVKVQSDGRIVAVGSSQNNNVKAVGSQDFGVVRYNTNGSLDSTFGVGGFVLTDISPGSLVSQDTADAVAIEPDGQIIVAGYAVLRAGQFSTDDTEFVVARYNTDGSRDTTFAPSSEVPGTLLVNFGLSDFAEGVVIQPQPDGKYVLGGHIGGSGATNDFAVARVTLTGQLDTTFSGDGKAQTHFPGTSFTRGKDVAIQPDGKIIVVGYVGISPTGFEDIAMARWESGLVLNTISGLASANEGATYTLNLQSTDPSTTQWNINWGDGNTQLVPGNPPSVTHVFADGTIGRTITATVTNSSGTFPVNSLSVTVNNVAPSFAINQASVVVNEGTTAVNSGTYSDVPADTVTMVASIGAVTQNAGVWNWSYNATDDLNQNVTITATDEDGGITVHTFNLKVNNVDPVITVNQSSVAGNQGNTATNSGTFSDVPADVVTIVASVGTITQIGNTWSWSYNTGSGLPPQTVTIAANDDNQGWSSVTFSLAIVPNLLVTNHTGNEASTVSITDIGTFTDVVQGGDAGPSIGLDATDFTTIGAFHPTSDVVFNTDTLTISGGFTGSGTTATSNAGFGAFQIAVFTFSSFILDAGVTIRATGSRPLALLSQGDMIVSGTIDLNAVSNATISVTLVDTPGAGGGAGGDGVSSTRDGKPAAGAPANAGGHLGPGGPLGGGSGSGGGSGGVGGNGEVFGSPTGNGGIDYVNLALAIQGGSGGSASGRNAGSGFAPLGGSGGGGVELGAANRVIVTSTGQVLANGSDGRTGNAAVNPGTGGGGGAGGNILIHGTNITNSGLLSAKGGSGGGGIHTGGGGAGGDVMFAYSPLGTLVDNGTKIVTGGAGGGVAAAAGEIGDVISITNPQTAAPVYETFSYVIDWGDGSPTNAGAATIDVPGVNVGNVVHGSFDGSHTYADNGNYTVSVTVTDSHGGSDLKTFTMAVANIAPTLTISGAANVNEAGSYTLNLSSFDTGPDTITSWTINWGDTAQVVSGNPTSVSHTYADGNANYAISATATDEDGTFAAGNTVAVAVHNVAPTLTISGASTVNEGSGYTLNLSSFDPGTDTIVSWTINWGDGTEVVSGNPSSASHTYADGNANYTISATATDEDGTFAAGNTVAVTVNNVAPTLSIAGAAAVTEGSLYTLALTSSDPGADTISSWTINWGDGTQVVSGNPSSATHTYADGPNGYTISATATDEDGTFAAGNTVAVTVTNVAPALSISGASDVNEGSSYTLNLSSIDPGADTISSWTINWGDSTEVVSGNPSTATHTYADGDASYTISATATDEDGTFAASSSVSVAVHNVAPTLSISGATSVNEASLYTLNLSSFDPGADTITSWTINWGDGSEVVSGNPASVSHTYADGNANYTISATATDEDGTFAAGNTVAVAVNNVAPTLTISGNATVNEGSSYTLNLSSFDPGPDTITSWTINWGDTTQVVSGNPTSVTHTYADGNANYTISATATDEDGTFAAGNTVSVAVQNVAPTVAISGASDVNEGSSYTLNLSSSDLGADTITSWTINWGDTTEVVSGNPSSITHTYADGDANYSITASATDEDGTFAAALAVAVAVHNVAPTLAINGASDVDEGSSYVFNLTSSDPGADTITQWTINWGDGTQIVSGNPSSVSHTYADGDANYTISATATDEDGTFAAGNTVGVAVHNVAPTLTLSGASNVNEGSGYTLNLSSLDPGTDTIASWTINWGDGIEVVSGNPASVSHTYADGNASYTVSATATDEDGTYAASNTVGVTVNNVAPTLAISGGADVNEGSSYMLNLSSSDPGTDTITSWTINWGDGTQIVSGNPSSISHTYADGDNNYTISATATDEDGTFAAGNTVAVAVHNVAPSLSISGAPDVNEGSGYTLNLSAFDPGTDTISQWTINWGDTTQVVSGNPTSVSHTYADGNASYTISATATDEDGTFAAGNTVGVTVHNVSPSLAISGAADVNEGSSYTLGLSSSDPGADTITSWTINWGESTQVVSGNPSSVSHTYADGDASYTISATATDEDGTFAAGNTVAVAVHNVAPTLVISGAAHVNEGSSYTLNLSSTDPGADTITQWAINWGDSTEIVSGNPASVTHTYADGTASYTISATATDEDGTFAAGNTVAVAVNNVAPTLVLSGAASINEGSSYTLSLSSTDPGVDTITQWTINWGDSTEVVSGNPSSASHTYADGTANYTISATATDEDGTYTAGNTVGVTVNNVAPTLALSGAASVDEGSSYTLNLSSSDPGADTITQWTINWGDTTQVVSGSPSSVTHTYADGTASNTISATATDEDGTYAAGNTVGVTVNNVAPTLTLAGAASVNEGSGYTLNLSKSDPGADTISQWTINWGDGIQVVSGNPSSVSHTYADGTASYTISATATDEDGTYAAGNTVGVTVNNVAPTLTLSGAASVNEGSSYTLNLLSVDPGADTISQWTINWGDGIQVVSGNPSSVSHIYADGTASYTISATATDEDGTYAAGNTVGVTVNNVAPTLTLSGAASVNEGSSYTLNLSKSDPGADTISQWTINWGDGIQVVSGNPSTVSHTYADGTASYAISATATDEDGTYAAGNTVGVTVNNVAPTLALSGAANVNEGSSYTLNLSKSDPGVDTISQWTINWGDSTQIVSGNPSSISHTYADGTVNYTISATATDEDGTYAASNTVALTVNNVAPTLALSGAASVNEGSSYTLNLSKSDPGADVISQWTINWGDSTQVVSGSPASVTHTYADGSASYTISATATDEDGTYAAGNTVGVTVNNVAPTLAISGAASVNEGSTYTLNLSKSDPGADTIIKWTINWGDGTQVVSGNPSSVTHVYADGNATSNYTISATATDEDGTYAAGNTVAVTVLNVAPTANAGGPYATFDDAPITLSGSGTDPAGAADPLTFKWDLDGDNIFGETGSGALRGNEVGANVTYNPAGLPTSTQTVKLQVSDGDGGVTVATTTVQILGQGTLAVGGVLYIVGSNTANDIVLITQCDNTIYVYATFNSNNPQTFNASSITDIQVRTRGGSDIVVTTCDVMETMTIDGGTGNDLLTGGGARSVIIGGTGNDILYGASGNDVLLGGDGNDDLFGGDGNDVLVGGNGNDILSGGNGRDVMIGSQDEDSLDGGNDEDVLIGGYTVHDNNVTALDAVMAIWSSSASFSSRVATLSGSGGLLQAGVTVFDDDDCDDLVGNAGRDLYFGDNSTLGDHVKDSISLQALQDQLIALT